MKINMFFVYPMMDIVNGESNLFRIVDNNLKETLVIYLITENNKYNINMINTMTGEINKILVANDSQELDSIIQVLIDNKKKIIKEKDLLSVEKYILNLTNN
ncbi:hypothetical protein [Terrisporobacter sp.]|uniref:hypothetical protein n=1 Tax=Terrisporobacter sp. TaxID=1965305 RepID=UPI002614BA0B|nr:hypothetical protein [Terrisporobacter sp.]